ncbi:MAG: rod-determining factor RdfA [Halodesulfurarchaeum sp.]
MGDNETRRGRPSKVARVIEEYGLDGLGAELEAAWTAPESERQSLRELADLVNRRIVRSVLERSGDRPLPGEIETVVEALAGETDRGTERDVTNRLEHLDTEQAKLAGDMVSYQAVRTYLQSVRDAEYEPRSTDPMESARKRINGLEGRLRAVTEGQLETLAERDEIVMGPSRVLVQVQVYCEECGRQFDVDELLERGGCGCE